MCFMSLSILIRGELKERLILFEQRTKFNIPKNINHVKHKKTIRFCLTVKKEG